jgi:hypothetical protein
MNRDSSKGRWAPIGAAIVVAALGSLFAATRGVNALRAYSALVAETRSGPFQVVEVPGEMALQLTRRGAYAIYYAGHTGASIHEEWPPTLDCNLTSQRTGEQVALVPDYVPTNRHVFVDGRIGILIYSTTVHRPGSHELVCAYADGRTGPRLTLAIGPNAVFEALRAVWVSAGSILEGGAIFCGSLVLSLGIAITGSMWPRKERVGGKHKMSQSQRTQTETETQGDVERKMRRTTGRIPPRWMFQALSILGAWASGIYLGKITLQGISPASLIPAVAFGGLSLLMAWGAVSPR